MVGETVPARLSQDLDAHLLAQPEDSAARLVRAYVRIVTKNLTGARDDLHRLLEADKGDLIATPLLAIAGK